ncbi:MAG: hypothetical protein BGN83_02590 [Rhizobium sp. 63-7]|nr:MAG: hypothetical protein BGN83_02590 [Rhizobium sp. 63-7]
MPRSTAQVTDFFKWRPEADLEPWFEADASYPRRLVPIAPAGRRALWILMAGMASAIPAVLLLALFDPHYLLVLGVIVLAEFGFPIWFLWRIRGRVKEVD